MIRYALRYVLAWKHNSIQSKLIHRQFDGQYVVLDEGRIHLHGDQVGSKPLNIISQTVQLTGDHRQQEQPNHNSDPEEPNVAFVAHAVLLCVGKT